MGVGPQLGDLLSHPALYHHVRQVLTGGLPLGRWSELAGLKNPRERVADVGCGPSDMLRVLSRQEHPGFYLGIDASERYLEAAAEKSSKLGIEARFVRLDLEQLQSSEIMRRELAGLLSSHGITSVLLFGILHHVTDEAARHTLDLVHSVSSVRRLVTQDIIRIDGHRVNNWFCRRDRGHFVRDEAGYDALVGSSRWEVRRKEWSNPGLSYIKYLHYLLSRDGR